LYLRDLVALETGEIPGVLVQRPACLLDRLAFLGSDEPAHLVAPNFVEGVVRETLDVEAIEHDARVRGALANGLDVGLRHVHRDRLELRGPLRTQGGEEGLERRRVLPWRCPDDAAGDVVEHDRDVLVVLAIRKLVDAYVLQAIKAIAREQASDHSRDDAAHRPPGDAHGCGNRRAVRDLGEVGDVVLEIPRVPGARVRPRNQLGAHAAATTIDATQVVEQRGLHATGIEVTPLASVAVVGPSRAAHAARTDRHTGRRCHGGHDAKRAGARSGNAGQFQDEHDSK
jgi:hypothetical protein